MIEIGKFYYHKKWECLNLVVDIEEEFDGGISYYVIRNDTGRPIHTTTWYNVEPFFVPVEVKIRSTRLAKKIYPKAKEEGEYLIIIDGKWSKKVDEILSFKREEK